MSRAEYMLNVAALTTSPDPYEPTTGTQYSVRLPGGEIAALNGDQEWVRDGCLREYLGAGVTVKRDVRIEYGPWRPDARPGLRVNVFFYPFAGFAGRGWTWCWEVNGDPMDDARRLAPARRSWQEAFDEAMAALADRLKDMAGAR